MSDEIKEIKEAVVNVRLDIRELHTEMRGFKELIKKVDEVDDIARDALQSTKSAHHRIDKLDKIVFWAATTIIGALVVGSITLLFKIRGVQ